MTQTAPAEPATHPEIEVLGVPVYDLCDRLAEEYPDYNCIDIDDQVTQALIALLLDEGLETALAFISDELPGGGELKGGPRCPATCGGIARLASLSKQMASVVPQALLGCV